MRAPAATYIDSQTLRCAPCPRSRLRVSFAVFPGLGAPDKCKETAMKPKIHPEYKEIAVICSCGNKFTTRSVLGRELHVEVCSNCHPFYTGKQKVMDTAGRVEKFRQRYSKTAAAKDAAKVPGKGA